MRKVRRRRQAITLTDAHHHLQEVPAELLAPQAVAEGMEVHVAPADVVELMDPSMLQHTGHVVHSHPDPERFAILSSQLEAIRQLAADFCLLDPNHQESSELALEMCEELRQLELDWRRSLLETAEQQEAAPILVEFATATASSSSAAAAVAGQPKSEQQQQLSAVVVEGNDEATEMG